MGMAMTKRHFARELLGTNERSACQPKTSLYATLLTLGCGAEQLLWMTYSKSVKGLMQWFLRDLLTNTVI